MADPLYANGYPALHNAANEASLRGQRDFLAALRVRLFGLLVGAVGGALLVSLSAPVAGGWVALVGFMAALAAELYTYIRRPDRRWYEGRAAAESAKTLTWRYVVGGQSFETSCDAVKVDREFLSRIGEVLSDLDGVSLSGATDSGEQITHQMRSIRALPFAQRKSIYREGRIEDQRNWYARKADENERAEHRWAIAVLSAEVLGVLGGALVIAGALTLDLLAIFAALAATITAWVQAKQHRTLSIAYSITAVELASIKSELDALEDESRWAEFVGEAEEAISREHTLWRASRGLRIRPRRKP